MILEFENNIPIFVQIVEKFKVSIISGELKSGEKLASVRELALQFKVNPNTMLKALTELEEVGLIFTERTNGKFVTTDTLLIEKFRKQYAKSVTKHFINCMSSIGYDKETILKEIEDIGDEWLWHF